MQLILISLIRLYQKTLSLFIGGECRFYPTCSSYSIEAIQKYGCFKGSIMTIGRIIRCNPLTSGGIDNVPDPEPKQDLKQKCSHLH